MNSIEHDRSRYLSGNRRRQGAKSSCRWNISLTRAAVFWFLFSTLVLFLQEPVLARRTDETSSPSSAEEATSIDGPYGWEELDCYQIIGFESDDEPDSQQIRKAYRKQAQQWHPDKQIGKKANATVSVQESNARFARISEAYQVLADDEKRREYDMYLSQQKRRKRQQESQRQNQQEQKSASSATTWSWSDFQMPDFSFQDARSLFEDFFFKEDDQEEDDFLRDFFRQYNGNAGGGSSSSSFFHDASYQQQYEPFSVREEEQIWIDPTTGLEVLRILQTENYLLDDKYYYRVLGQDFVEKWDRYQRMFVYVPLQLEPVVVEEGYREAPPSTAGRRQQQRGSFRTSQHQRPNQHVGTSARDVFGEQNRAVLFTGETFTTAHRLENSRFYAGISLSSNSYCELMIMDTLWDAVVWTSGSPRSHWYLHGDSCQLELRGPQLLLSSTYPEYELLWHSNSPQEEFDVGGIPNDQDSSYVARLDSDGSLAVYQVEPLLDRRRPAWSRMLLTLGHRLGWVDEVRLAVPPVRLICISATGPAGCRRLLRPIVRFIRDAFLSVKWLLTALDRLIEESV